MTSYAGLASSVLARVDLPEPFGPMRAWSAPGSTARDDAAEDLAAVDGDVEVVDLERGASGGSGASGATAPL